jgi:hypothetical protein
MVRRPVVLSALLLVGLVGCHTSPDKPPYSDVDAVYARGLADAAVATPAKLRPLLPIPQTPTVSVVSWVNDAEYQAMACPDHHYPCTYSVPAVGVWVTITGEVLKKCHDWKLKGAALELRLAQVLGLPPLSQGWFHYPGFIIFEVPRDALKRPCFGLDTANPAAPVCKYLPDDKVSADLMPRDFVANSVTYAWHYGDTIRPGYPFTRLGYTYDWNPMLTDHYGTTEFLIAPGTKATVTAESGTDAYCEPAK